MSAYAPPQQQSPATAPVAKPQRLLRSTTPLGQPTGAIQPIGALVNRGTQGGGRPLDTSTRAIMESRFGHDFSKVRIFTDARAEESAQAVNAQAYTMGPNLVFGRGMYAPNSSAGQHLLAHELTHVVQQSKSGGTPSTSAQAKLNVNRPGDAAEREADAAATQVLAGRPVTVAAAAPSSFGGIVQRREVCDDNGVCYSTDDAPNTASLLPPAQQNASPVTSPAPAAATEPAASDGQFGPPAPNACYPPAPEPNFTPAAGPAPEDPSSPGMVSLCNRDFTGALGGLVPARHCFAWYHENGSNMTPASIDPANTSTYDNKTSGTPDPDPNKDANCPTTFDVDPECVRQQYAAVSPSDYSLDENNCCSTAYKAILNCGGQPHQQDFPAENHGMGLPDGYGGGWKKDLFGAGRRYLEHLGSGEGTPLR